MKLNKMTICSLLLAIGLLFHQIAPPFFFGMRPDFLLIMMFICLLIDKNYKTAVLVGLVSGIMTAMTTTFPAGQIPNMLDKIVTSHVLFFLIKLSEDFKLKKLRLVLLSMIGTLVSGTVFLGSALVLVSLPAPFKVLFLTVVLPAAAMNSLTSIFIYSIVEKALDRLSIEV